MTLTDADITILEAYLAGTLDDEREVFRFEERLTREPELAEALDASQRIDVLAQKLRRGARESVSRAPARESRRPFWLVGLALATAAGILGMFLLRPGPPAVQFAVVACGPNLRDNNRELGLDAKDVNKVPAGSMRGGDQESAGVVEVPVEEYLALVEPVQERRLLDALEGRYRLVDAEYFVVGLRTTRACSVVVLLVDDAGRVLGPRAEPNGIAWPQDVQWTSASGRIDAPGDHVLPRPNVVAGEEKLYEPGFLVPRGAGHVTALVGSVASPLAADLKRDLQVAIDSASGSPDAVERLTRWLVEREFQTQEWVVPERR